MSTKPEKLSPEVVAAIDAILRSRMARWGYTLADIRPGYDHDGDPVVHVDAHYALRPEPLDPRATRGLTGEVIEAIQALGEERFPLIRHRFHELQTTTR